MRDAKVEQVEHVSDSDSDEKDGEEKGVSLTIGIFPSSQPPTYLLMSSKAELVHASFFLFSIPRTFVCAHVHAVALYYRKKCFRALSAN